MTVLKTTAGRSVLIAITIAVALVAFYFYWFKLENGQFLSDNSENWGHFGDYFGGMMNPIIAGLALYWLTESIRMQERELAATRQALDDQKKSNDLKRFEETYFALLAEHNALLGLLKSTRDGEATIVSVHDDVFVRTSYLGVPNTDFLRSKATMLDSLA